MFGSSSSASGGGGDLDSLLSSAASDEKLLPPPPRRLPEPYERHRAHALRAECYRRGLRPIKKGPHANDNKLGYVQLLRQHDADASTTHHHHHSASTNSNSAVGTTSSSSNGGTEHVEQTLDGDSDALPSLAKQQQRLVAPHALVVDMATGSSGSVVTAPPTAPDLSAFYENALPVPTTYTAPAKPLPPPPTGTSATNGSATDLEILSGIANSYTQNAASESDSGPQPQPQPQSPQPQSNQLCTNCRTAVADQLPASSWSQLQVLEAHRATEQRDRDTHHLKTILSVLLELRRALREAQTSGGNGTPHDVLLELEDDIAFFQALKERTKARMRLALLTRDSRVGGFQAADNGAS